MTYVYMENNRIKMTTEDIPSDMSGWVEVNIPSKEIRYDGENFYSVPYIEPVIIEEIINLVPQYLSPRQIRMVLTANNLRQAVEDMVAASTDYNLKDWWEYSLEYRRDNELLIGMAITLGLSSEQVDSMFIQGATL